jgi:guanine deaminase
MPGLVDAHNHPSQYSYTGTGYDLSIQQRLEMFKIPTEDKFADIETARTIYPKAVRRSLLNGTTTASYLATVHLDSTMELCRICADAGQRVHVGKVNMDREQTKNSTQHSVEETRKFIKSVREMKNPLMEPAVAPRFTSTCSQPLLRALGELASELAVPVHSHLGQQREEVTRLLQDNPSSRNPAHLFEMAGMLNSRTYMAHCVYTTEQEVELLRERQVGVVHCPNSNFSLRSGCLDVRGLLNSGVTKIALGTDVSGGYTSSILDAMRCALHTSKAVCFKNDEQQYDPLTLPEVLYMATMGGASVLGLDSKIGNFQVGKEFDALIIDTAAPCGNPVFDLFERDTNKDKVSKFLYLGDDRNIVSRFVAGKKIIV